jgi:hypothetical protein
VTAAASPLTALQGAAVGARCEKYVNDLSAGVHRHTGGDAARRATGTLDAQAG